MWDVRWKVASAGTVAVLYLASATTLTLTEVAEPKCKSIALFGFALLLPSWAAAQTCSDLVLSANSGDGTTGMWSSAQTPVGKSRVTATFELQSGNGVVGRGVLHSASANPTATDPLVGIRAASNGRWWFLDGDDGWVDSAITAASCTEFEVVLDSEDSCWTVSVNGGARAWPLRAMRRRHSAADSHPNYYGVVKSAGPNDFRAAQHDVDHLHARAQLLGETPASRPTTVSGSTRTRLARRTHTRPAMRGPTRSVTGSPKPTRWPTRPGGTRYAGGFRRRLTRLRRAGRHRTNYTTAHRVRRLRRCGRSAYGDACVPSIQDSNEATWRYETPEHEVYLDSVGPGTVYHIRRIDTYSRGELVSNGYVDLAMGWTHETIPPPYVDEIYDHTDAAERANCTDMLAQGFDYGGEINHECNYAVLYADTFGLPRGWCVDPWEGFPIGGDSGGPLYAIGDWDGAGPGTPYAKLAGTQTGGGGGDISGYPWNAYTMVQPYLAWFNANVDGPSETLLTVGAVSFEDVELAWDEGQDIDAADVPVTCKVTATITGGATITAAGCEMGYESGETVLSKADTTPVGDLYEVDFVLPQGSSSDWRMQAAWVATSDGDVVRATYGDLRPQGVKRLDVDADLTAGYERPVMETRLTPQNPAPGGDLICSQKFASGAQASLPSQTRGVFTTAEVACAAEAHRSSPPQTSAPSPSAMPRHRGPRSPRTAPGGFPNTTRTLASPTTGRAPRSLIAQWIRLPLLLWAQTPGTRRSTPRHIWGTTPRSTKSTHG